MPENPYFVKPGIARRFPRYPDELHRMMRVPVSPMRLTAMAKHPKQLLTLSISSDWRLTHVELHQIIADSEPHLVPQSWRDDIGVLVLSGSIQAETMARQQHQVSVIEVGSLLRLPQTHDQLPTRTTLTSLTAAADFALLGNHPALYC